MGKVDPDELRSLIERLEDLLDRLPDADLIGRFIKAVDECPDADSINRLARAVKEYREIS
jgi:hypothetical protein